MEKVKLTAVIMCDRDILKMTRKKIKTTISKRFPVKMAKKSERNKGNYIGKFIGSHERFKMQNTRYNVL